MQDLTPEQIEEVVKTKAVEFTDTYINDPTEAQYALIEKAVTLGWQLGVQQAIKYMNDHGIVVKGE